MKNQRVHDTFTLHLLTKFSMPNKNAQHTFGGHRITLLQPTEESAPHSSKSPKKRTDTDNAKGASSSKKQRLQEASSDDETPAPPSNLAPATLLGLDFNNNENNNNNDDDDEPLSSVYQAIMDPGSDVTKNREIGQQYTQLIIGGLNILGSKQRL
jgi:hypothetical protein